MAVRGVSHFSKGNPVSMGLTEAVSSKSEPKDTNYFIFRTKTTANNLRERLEILFELEKSLHVNPKIFHFSGVAHELRYYNFKKLKQELRALCLQKKLFRYRVDINYRTSIYSNKKLNRDKKQKFHNAIVDSISYLNEQKGFILENLVARTLRHSGETNVIQNFRVNLEELRKCYSDLEEIFEIDIFSENYIVECKNFSRDNIICDRYVDNFIENKNRLSKTHLADGKKFIFVGSHIAKSTKEKLSYNNILYIEIGFQVLEYLTNREFHDFFNKWNFKKPKSQSLDNSCSFIYTKLSLFIKQSFSRSRSVDYSVWKILILNFPKRYKNQILEELANDP